MKKLIATSLLLLSVTIGFAGRAGDSAVNNPKTQVLCHDADGKWDPQDKRCDPNSCGCLFHQIEEFIVGIFD